MRNKTKKSNYWDMAVFIPPHNLFLRCYRYQQCVTNVERKTRVKFWLSSVSVSAGKKEFRGRSVDMNRKRKWTDKKRSGLKTQKISINNTTATRETFTEDARSTMLLLKNGRRSRYKQTKQNKKGTIVNARNPIDCWDVVGDNIGDRRNTHDTHC